MVEENYLYKFNEIPEKVSDIVMKLDDNWKILGKSLWTSTHFPLSLFHIYEITPSIIYI